MTILVMYSVYNALDWGRDIDREFSGDDDLFRNIWANRRVLDARFYNMSNRNYGDPVGQYGILNADEFEVDYNDELYDGGWWTKVLFVDDDFVLETIID